MITVKQAHISLIREKINNCLPNIAHFMIPNFFSKKYQFLNFLLGRIKIC